MALAAKYDFAREISAESAENSRFRAGSYYFLLPMGIERSVDKLGRIVVPIEYREKLGIKAEDKVVLNLDGGKITVSPLSKICALCGRILSNHTDIRVCADCIEKIKRY